MKKIIFFATLMAFIFTTAAAFAANSFSLILVNNAEKEAFFALATNSDKDPKTFDVQGWYGIPPHSSKDFKVDVSDKNQPVFWAAMSEGVVWQGKEGANAFKVVRGQLNYNTAIDANGNGLSAPNGANVETMYFYKIEPRGKDFIITVPR